ncbi:hypothetical protein ANCCAN_00560 [Ancylostoma caninum]|uniref:Uncharacterized protein n=1 Tax=Ancylostoma caninum TaxID=29170 RepID=A0A368HA74_ANCCA|nr:hypothetical protein ANCCAN_00560 [Ancylostoma caninum]
MFTLLLVSVLYLATPSLEFAIDNQGSGCMIDQRARKILYDFHADLLGEGKELVYVCELEKKASDEQRGAGSSGASKVFQFSGEYTGRSLEGLQTILSTVNTEEVLEALHVVLHYCSSHVLEIVGPESNSFWMFGKTVPE